MAKPKCTDTAIIIPRVILKIEFHWAHEVNNIHLYIIYVCASRSDERICFQFLCFVFRFEDQLDHLSHLTLALWSCRWRQNITFEINLYSVGEYEWNVLAEICIFHKVSENKTTKKAITVHNAYTYHNYVCLVDFGNRFQCERYLREGIYGYI